MKHDRSNNAQAGFNRSDLLVLVAMVAVASLAAPFLVTHAHARSVRVSCVNNLKQIGLAARMWSNEHNEHFPWRVSTNAGGTLELVASGGAYRQFLALSNELVSPRPLACMEDKERKPAVSFHADFKDDRNVSYFIGLDASEVMPQTILAGDRNIAGGNLDPAGIMRFAPTQTVGWTKAIHREKGNVALADGSAHQLSSSLMLQRGLQSHLLQTNSARFLIPLTP